MGAASGVGARRLSSLPSRSAGSCGGRRRSAVRLSALSAGASAALGLALHATLPPDDDASGESEEEKARYEAFLSSLPELEHAQATKAVLIKKFLSEEDLAEFETQLSELNRLPLGTFSRDARGVPQLVNATWVTTYLHTDGSFRRVCSGLHQRLFALAEHVNAQEGWGLMEQPQTGACGQQAERSPAAAKFRTIELHSVRAGGALPDRQHFDGGSLITIDIMLARPGVDFAGGEFCTPEADGTTTEHAFARGDALVFVSHKRHFVRPVSSGIRRVLVAELWCGPERTCAHRCPDPRGCCAYTLGTAQAERFVRAELPDY